MPPSCRLVNSHIASGHAVDGREHIKTVVIDSLNGYQASMPEEQYLTLHLHEMLQYLNRQGASTFLMMAQHGMIGDMKQPVDVTYLADTVIMLRYFEAFGRVRRAISVIKKRRALTKTPSGNLRSAMPASRRRTLTEFQGVLRGVPVYAARTKLSWPAADVHNPHWSARSSSRRAGATPSLPARF